MTLDQFQRVLVLGAHPDDEMACAGTVARLAASGADIELVTFSNCSDEVPTGFTPSQLIQEWREAARVVGVTRLTMHSLPNRNLPDHRQEILDILDRYRKRDIDLVLVGASNDSHQDHATVTAEAKRAFRLMRTTILGYELPMNHVSGFVVTGFVCLEEKHVDLKVKVVQAYRSQAGRTYMAENFVRGLAAVRGVQCGATAAEAFDVIRWVGR